MILLDILRLPFRIVRAPLSVVLLAVGVKHRRSFNLPVAGLDEAKAQSIFFALKRAANTPEASFLSFTPLFSDIIKTHDGMTGLSAPQLPPPLTWAHHSSMLQEERVAQEWLASLQIVQVASGRILAELDRVDANLQFWTRRLDARGHFWFTLLRRGPAEFFRRATEMFRRWRGRRAIVGAERGAEVSASELVEKRVLILRLLRGELCEAAAAVQRAGALLYLQRPLPGSAVGSDATDQAGSASSLGASSEDALFSRADGAVRSSMDLVAGAVSSLQRSVHTTLDSQQGPQATAVNDRPMLAQALNRVLGVSRLRRVWTPTPTEGAAASAAAGPNGATVTLNASDLSYQQLQGSPISASLASAAQVLQYTPLIAAEATVHTSLAEARRSAVLLQHGRRLVALPEWLTMPSQAQQHWVHYTVVGLVVGYGTLFVFRHSRLCGSRDLENWAQAAATAVQGAWAEHVVGPLERVKGELFNTFRRRPAIVSMQEYEADRDSLQRMLEDFKTDFIKKRGTKAATVTTGGSVGTSAAGDGGNGTGSSSAGDAEVLRGMDLMMRSYEQELKRPIRHLVSGDLMRSLLIQVQKLKVDTESAMLEIDQILRANELSISLVAAVPTFLIAGFALYGLGRVLTPAPPDPRTEAVSARLAMIEVERALEALAVSEGGEGPSAGSPEAEGLLAYRLAVAYCEAEELFRRHRGLLRSAGDAEWPNLRSDLLELATPAPTEHKLRTAARMMRAYAIYQQF